MKGQSQIILVLAIMVFVVVVIIFAFQRGIIFPPDESVYELKKTLTTEVENKIASISSEIIKEVGKNGGYLVSPTNLAEGENEVTYWQICQDNIVPKINTIEQSISNGIESRLNSNKIDNFQGKNVISGDVEKIEVSVRRDDVLVRIWMPVSIDDVLLNQPFEIILPIELGRAYDFASSFINDNVANRHISTFIASLLYHSPNTYLPTVGMLTRCGESIVVTYDDAKERVNDILDYVGSNTVFWENEPSDTDYLKYYIPDVMGKTFDDLEISLRQIGKLNPKTFQSSMNPIVLVNSRPYHKILPVCSLPYDVRYDIMPSFVVSAKTNSGFEFNFGLEPFVKNSRIGECTGADELVQISNACVDAKCDASVSVKDSDNLPIKGSSVIYGSCSIGKTGDNGIVSGKIPCGIAPLIVSNTEYITEYDIVSSFDLENKEVVLNKGPAIKIHFYRALADNAAFQGFGSNTQFYFNILGLNSEIATNEDVIVTISQKNESPWSTFETVFSNKLSDGEVKNTLSIDYIPSGKYEFEVESFKSMLFSTRFCVKETLGGFGPCDKYQRINEQVIVPTKLTYEFEIKENTTDIYVTAILPSVNTVNDVPGELDYTQTLTSISGCLVPVSESEPKASCRV